MSSYASTKDGSHVVLMVIYFIFYFILFKTYLYRVAHSE